MTIQRKLWKETIHFSPPRSGASRRACNKVQEVMQIRVVLIRIGAADFGTSSSGGQRPA